MFTPISLRSLSAMRARTAFSGIPGSNLSMTRKATRPDFSIRAIHAAKDDIVTANLRIPAGREVLLRLHSRDVIHDFFVRELRTKQDIVPGMEIPLEMRVERPGTYEIACAELCGLGHSQMRSLLIVMTPAEYDQWKRSR